MYIFRTEFYLVFQAMCYIVQSANKDECKIPEEGWKCGGKVDSTNKFTAIYMGHSHRRMQCRSQLTPAEVLRFVVQLRPDGQGKNCEEFSFEFKDEELYISRHSPSEEGVLTISKSSDMPDEWCLDTTKVLIAKSDPSATTATTQPLSTQISHIKFSIEDIHVESHNSKENKHARVDRIYDIYVGDSKNAVFKVKESEIRPSSDKRSWTLGYQVLQRHEVILMKLKQEFFIGIMKANAPFSP